MEQGHRGMLSHRLPIISELFRTALGSTPGGLYKVPVKAFRVDDVDHRAHSR